MSMSLEKAKVLSMETGCKIKHRFFLDGEYIQYIAEDGWWVTEERRRVPNHYWESVNKDIFFHTDWEVYEDTTSKTLISTEGWDLNLIIKSQSTLEAKGLPSLYTIDGMLILASKEEVLKYFPNLEAKIISQPT